MKIFFFGLIFAAIAQLTCADASAKLLSPEHATFESKILNQQRALDVYLPKDYEKNPAQRYETIYVLDGDWNAKIVVETVDFLQSVGFMPPVLVVSVPNHFDDKGINSRDHDLTPTALKHEPRSGGSANFLLFLKTELVPYVNAHYPASGVNLIHGHSYGGLFLTYVIANDPTVFDGYLILDPAMWWDDYVVSKSLDTSIIAMPTQGKAIFIAGRTGNAFKGMGVDTLQPVFDKAPAALHWKIVAYPNETHDSLKFKATFDALKFAYRGYSEQKIDILFNTGIVTGGQPLFLQADTDRFDFYYTTDGSEPTALSSKIDRFVPVLDPTNFRIREISTRGHLDQEISTHLTRGEALAPVRPAKGDENKEFRYAYYNADAWPKFRGAPFESGKAPDIDIDHVKRERFAGVIERDYAVPSDGYYTFVTGASDGGRLSVAGKTLMDIHPDSKNGPRVFVVPLRAGVYPVRFEFLHASKDTHLVLGLYQFKNDGTGWENELK